MISKPDYLKVAGEEGLVRDTHSNAILATDLAAKYAHMEREKRELNISKIGDMTSRLDHVENDLDDIKTMLKSIINNLSNQPPRNV